MKVHAPEKPSSAWRYEDAAYGDWGALERELRRVADICHQCRRCLPLCPSFPKLFELVDASPSEVAGVAPEGFDEVNELCYHCKLCYNHCPYTPPHEWDVDFPALMRRHQQARAARDGVPLARKLTTRTDFLGRVGALAPALMNFANKNKISRVLMEKTLGLHRDWVQPKFHRETVARWFKKRAKMVAATAVPTPAAAVPATENARAEAPHIALFTTCSVNYNDPEAGRAAVRVLEHNGVRVTPAYERCCGMPFTDTGDMNAARKNAARNVAELLPLVEAGALVVAPGPSCSLMLKEEYPRLLPGNDGALRVARATRDLMEFLHALAREKKLRRNFVRSLGRVAYHAPCHLRAQNIGFRSRDVLRLCADEVTLVDACSGVDGTWGMQAKFHAASLQVADKMLRGIERAGADRVATDCPLSALRIQEGLGVTAKHPVVLLREAYGLPA